MSARAFAQTQRQAAFEATPAAHGLLQRKCDCGNRASGGACEQCAKKGGLLQSATASPRGRENGDASEMPPIVHDVLRSPGQPLDAQTRAFMEPRFGHDFSQVRLHADARAAASARAVNALAYTVGQNIVLGAQQYAPATPHGRGLLAHELAHTIQQSQSRAAGALMKMPVTVSEGDDVYEQEANRVGNALAHGAAAAVRVQLRQSTPTIQRQTVPSGITLKESKPFGHGQLKSDEDKKKYRTYIGATTLLQLTPAGDYAAGRKRGECTKEFLTEVSNTCPPHDFCSQSKCLEVDRYGTAGDPSTGVTVTDGPDTFIDRHRTAMPDSLLEGSGKDKCSVVCHQRYKYRTEPDRKYVDLGSFYIIRNFGAGKYTPPGSKDAVHITTGEVKKVPATLEAPSKEKFAKDIAPGLLKSGALLEASPIPKDREP